MRQHVFAAAMLSTAPLAYGADDVTVQAIEVRADRPSNLDRVAVVENDQARNRTLGGMLEQVSGVQSSAFGPNAGAPVIRSLGGSRVQILENGQSILGMNALSGDINIHRPVHDGKIRTGRTVIFPSLPTIRPPSGSARPTSIPPIPPTCRARQR